MSGNNIIHLNVDNANLTSRSEELGFNIISSTTIIDNSEDYEVYIEKCELPIPKSLPIFKSTGALNVVFEATDKTNKSPFFGEDMFRTVAIDGQIIGARDLAGSVNAALEMLGVDYQWFSLAAVGELLTLKVSDAEKARLTKIHLPLQLFSAFTELPCQDLDFNYKGVPYFEVYSPKPAGANDYFQSQPQLAQIANLKTFRLYSTLPTEPFWLYNQIERSMTPSNLLGEVIFDSKNMIGNTNIIYVPPVFRYCSMTSAGGIKNFRLWVCAYYFNGEEVRLKMSMNDYVSITLAFQRKQKI